MVQHSPSLSVGQLVCVTQYYPHVNGAPQIGPALAVGRMALAGDQIRSVGKGKAVNIIHTWKDHLWELGGKDDPPPPRVIEINQEKASGADSEGPVSGNSDPVIETTPQSPGEGTSHIQGDPPSAMPPKETNSLSQQGSSFTPILEVS